MDKARLVYIRIFECTFKGRIPFNFVNKMKNQQKLRNEYVQNERDKRDRDLEGGKRGKKYNPDPERVAQQ
eukprot:3186111-Karenia_brevis.AAC.1